jgi:photosystem II stability/assembly factor-like uncharacterized protein
MSEERLAVAIRDAFDSTHVPSPGLEHRVVSAIPWDRPRERTTSLPKLGGAMAVALGVVAVAILVVPTILSRFNFFPGSGPEAPAYSLAAVSGDSVFVVQRANGNVLLQSKDGGRSWVDRLHFPNVYDGMQMFGADGFIWTIDMSMPNCKVDQVCTTPPSSAMTVYATSDGGATWTARPATGFAVEDAFFLDSAHGWADSDSPAIGLNAEVLYETGDGGKTWSRVGDLPKASPMGYVYGVGIYRVTFSRQGDGSLRGWYVGATQLYVTSDGGRTWVAVTLGVPGPVAGWLSTPSQPTFAGSEGVLPVAYHDPKGADNATPNRIYLYVSHDGGATWGDPRPAPAGFAPVGDILSVAILDSQHIWLTSQSETGGDNVQAGPAVARTTDGGRAWTVFHDSYRILQMTFGDTTHGYALDVTGMNNVNGILSTTDGGATWHRVTVPVVPDLRLSPAA